MITFRTKEENEDYRFITPFACFITGASGAGKTHLVTEMIRLRRIESPSKIYYICPETFDRPQV